MAHGGEEGSTREPEEEMKMCVCVCVLVSVVGCGRVRCERRPRAGRRSREAGHGGEGFRGVGVSGDWRATEEVGEGEKERKGDT